MRYLIVHSLNDLLRDHGDDRDDNCLENSFEHGDSLQSELISPHHAAARSAWKSFQLAHVNFWPFQLAHVNFCRVGLALLA